MFVTHTISEDSNYAIREQQADELVDLIDKSGADFVILGGDFNASPLMEMDKTYDKIKKVMTDAFQEIMDNVKAWINEEFATYANPRNTYTGGKDDLKPVIYDYIFHKKKVNDSSNSYLYISISMMFLSLADSRCWYDLDQLVLSSIPEDYQQLQQQHHIIVRSRSSHQSSVSVETTEIT